MAEMIKIKSPDDFRNVGNNEYAKNMLKDASVAVEKAKNQEIPENVENSGTNAKEVLTRLAKEISGRNNTMEMQKENGDMQRDEI